MRVFISSTYIDLAEYREAVAKAVNAIGHDVILWEQQEISAGESIVESINKSIDEADVFVLIIGDRSGAQVEGSAASGTEYEYTLAETKNKPILVFIKSPESGEQAGGRLSAFAERIMQKSYSVRMRLDSRTFR